jgi:hypothetical protein
MLGCIFSGSYDRSHHAAQPGVHGGARMNAAVLVYPVELLHRSRAAPPPHNGDSLE